MIESKLMEVYLERCKKEPEFKQELLDTVSTNGRNPKRYKNGNTWGGSMSWYKVEDGYEDCARMLCDC